MANAHTDEIALAVLSEYLAAAVTESVRSSPATLLDEHHAMAWIDLAHRAGHGSDQLTRYSRRVAAVLRALLTHHLAIVDTELICRYLHEGMTRGMKDATVVETLITRLQPSTLEIEFHPGAAPLAELGPGALPASLEDLPAESGLRNSLEQLRDGVFSELGVRVPTIRLVAGSTIPEQAFRLRSGTLVCTPWPGLSPTELLVDQSPAALEQMTGIAGRLVRLPRADRDFSIIDTEMGALARERGCVTWNPTEYFVLAVAQDIKRNAAALLDLAAVEEALAQLDVAFPELVCSAIEKFGVVHLTQVLRRLLLHDVPIRNMRAILEQLLAYDYVSVDTRKDIVLDRRLPIDLRLDPHFDPDVLERHIEFVRSGLRDWISDFYSGGSRSLLVVLLDPAIENAILDELAYRQDYGRGSPIGYDGMEQLQQAFRRQAGPNGRGPAILTITQVATFLRNELRAEFPAIPVVAFPELDSGLSIKTVDRITLVS